jgi:hypothetical protein
VFRSAEASILKLKKNSNIKRKTFLWVQPSVRSDEMPQLTTITVIMYKLVGPVTHISGDDG